ncbi:MAG TPA: ATP-binding protein [Moraxellaceae bacterium]|nr:ATP-binding protein [Moraxellaceae bacterium]
MPLKENVIRFALACMLALCAGLAAAAGADVGAVRLAGGAGGQSLGTHVEVLRDPGGRLAPAAAALADGYAPASVAANLGFDPGAAYWFRFRLENPGDTLARRVFLLDFPLLDHVELFAPDGKGGYLRQVTGDNEAWHERPLKVRRLALPLEVPPHAARDFLVRIRTSTPVVFPAAVQPEESFWGSLNTAQFWQGMFYGAVALLLSYSLFLYISARERIFLIYTVAVLATVFCLFCLDGFAFQLFPDTSAWQNYLLPLGIAISNLAYLRFALLYLRIGRDNAAHRHTRWLTAACLLMLLVLPWLGPALGGALMLAQSVAVAGWMFWLGLGSLAQARTAGNYYVVAWGLYAASSVVSLLLALAVLPWISFYVPVVRAGLVVWAVLLLLGLGWQLRRRREAEASRREEALFVQAQTEARSKFLAMVSHELRTPMTGVLGMAELLKTTGLNTEQNRILATMENSGQAVLEVIDDVLDHARIEAGRMALELAPLDLDVLLEECLDLFKARIYKQQLTLLCSIAPEVPTEIIGDGQRLRQVLINLLSNAVKFTSRGGIEVRVRAEPAEEGRLRLALAVSDTGIGIAPEDRARIFDSFMQETPDSVHYRGTGLGLSVSRELCQLMGGDLTVESEPGLGSVFRAEVRVTGVARSRPRAQWPADQAAVRLLLVEGDHRFNEVMVAEAATPGFQLESVQSGEAAFARLLEAAAAGTPFGLVATALQLPDMNGLTLHNRIAREPALRGCKTLLFALPQLQPSPGVLVHAGVAHAFERPVLARELRQAALAVVRRQPDEASPVRVSTPQYPGLRVLVAEDNRTNQVVIQGMLRRFGIQAELVENGEQAVAACRRARPTFDLVFMDCEMPVMDGYAATREIRRLESQEGRSRVPIVAISAHVTQHHVDNCYAAGMDDHIPKPLNLRLLGDKLAQWAPMAAVGQTV